MSQVADCLSVGCSVVFKLHASYMTQSPVRLINLATQERFLAHLRNSIGFAFSQVPSGIGIGCMIYDSSLHGFKHKNNMVFILIIE